MNDYAELLEKYARVEEERDRLKAELDTYRKEMAEFSAINADAKAKIIAQMDAMNVEILYLNINLRDAKDIILRLTRYLPDSNHDDESWQYCWEELSDTAQDAVVNIRAEAQVFLDIGSGG